MSARAAPSPGERARIRAVAIVPARLASQRLPRKMLLAETGTPLFAHTARRVALSGAIERVVVATDSEEIEASARALGIECVRTRPDHASGTDRVFEAWQMLAAADAGEADVVLDVQGDEPELDPEDLGRLVAAFHEAEVEIATLCGPVSSPAEADFSHVVKVVRDARGDALYFSRSAIPHRASPPGGEPSRAYSRAGAPPWLGALRRHVGVYAFRPAALARFCALPEGTLEGIENLEQLRWLESGRRMRVLDALHVPLGIDTRSDYDAFVERVLRASAAEPGSRPPRSRASGRRPD